MPHCPPMPARVLMSDIVWPENTWEFWLEEWLRGPAQARLDRTAWCDVDRFGAGHPRIRTTAVLLLDGRHPRQVVGLDGVQDFCRAIGDARLMADRCLAHAGRGLRILRAAAATWQELEDTLYAERRWLDQALHLADLPPLDPRGVLADVDEQYARAAGHTNNPIGHAHAAKMLFFGYGRTQHYLTRQRRALFIELAASGVPVAAIAAAAGQRPTAVRAAIAERTTLSIPDLRWLRDSALAELTGRPAPPDRPHHQT